MAPRPLSLLVLLMPAMLLALGCSSAHVVRKDMAGGMLIVRCATADAEIYVDDAYLGSASQLHRGRRLIAGPHRLEVRRPGYFSAYRDFTIVAGKRYAVRVALQPRPF